MLKHVVSGTLIALGVMASPLSGQSAIPNGTVREGVLSFDGPATVGDFVGTTTTVTGEMTGGPDLASVRGWVEAPVQTLKTGNGKRDRDLNKSMESDKYPTMRFELLGVTPGTVEGDSAGATLHGMLLLHGVAREVALPASVRLKGDTTQVHSDFPLNLKDYQIGGLSKMFGMLKMHPDITVHVDLKFQ